MRLLRSFLLTLALLAGVSAHAVTLDSGNIAQGSQQFGNSFTLSVNCPGTDNLLVVYIGTDIPTGQGGSQAPTSVTYNSVSMTQAGSLASDSDSFAATVWYITGACNGSAHNVAISYNVSVTNVTAIMYAALPYSGANTSTPLGTVATAFSTTTINPAVTATGGVTNDLYNGFNFLGTTTQTSGGSQTNVAYQSSINSALSGRVDTLPGSGSGAFTWSGTGTTFTTNWVALAVAVKDAGATMTHGALLSNGKPVLSNAKPVYN